MAVQYHYGSFPPEELDWKRLIPAIGRSSGDIVWNYYSKAVGDIL